MKLNQVISALEDIWQSGFSMPNTTCSEKPWVRRTNVQHPTLEYLIKKELITEVSREDFVERMGFYPEDIETKIEKFKGLITDYYTASRNWSNAYHAYPSSPHLGVKTLRCIFSRKARRLKKINDELGEKAWEDKKNITSQMGPYNDKFWRGLDKDDSPLSITDKGEHFIIERTCGSPGTAEYDGYPKYGGGVIPSLESLEFEDVDIYYYNRRLGPPMFLRNSLVIIGEMSQKFEVDPRSIFPVVESFIEKSRCHYGSNFHYGNGNFTGIYSWESAVEKAFHINSEYGDFRVVVTRPTEYHNEYNIFDYGWNNDGKFEVFPPQ